MCKWVEFHVGNITIPSSPLLVLPTLSRLRLSRCSCYMRDKLSILLQPYHNAHMSSLPLGRRAAPSTIIKTTHNRRHTLHNRILDEQEWHILHTFSSVSTSCWSPDGIALLNAPSCSRIASSSSAPTLPLLSPCSCCSR